MQKKKFKYTEFPKVNIHNSNSSKSSLKIEYYIYKN